MVRALTHGMLVSAALEGARLLDFQPGQSFLVRSMPGGGAFFDEWLIPLLAGGTAYVAGFDMLDSAAAPVTHLRLTTPEWANQAADWGHEGEPCSPTLRCVAVEAGSPLLSSASIWQKQSTPHLRQVVFFSPASLCGLGLAGVIRKNAVRIPTGKPTAECEAVIADADGLEIPPGYVGRLFLKFPGWKNLPDAGGRLGFDTGLNAWRDWEGDLYVESGLRKVNGLPTAEEIKSVRELFPQVLDVFVCLQGVFALSDQAVGHAVCQKQWLLNRAGWIDESALPQPAQPVASQPQPSVAPASPKVAEPAVQTRRAPQSAWTPLVEMCSKGSGSTLVLVHPANGLTDSYSELLYALGNSRRVIGIAARGALNPEACHPSIESAAAQYIAALFEDAPLQNFQLAGFGFGAIVALEMARQLQAAGRTLPRLVLIGAMPPPTDEPGGWLASMKKVFMRSATASRMEPLAPSSAAAMRHEAILKNYRFPACDIPATIVLPADLAESSAPWQELLPGAAVEITRSSWSEMLSNPGVKRIASILAEDKL
jgi:thioesterase domain-containing protein